MLDIDYAMCLHHVKRAAPVESLKSEMDRLGIDYRLFLANDGPSSIYQIDYIDDPEPDVSQWHHGVHKDRHYNAFCCHKEMINMAAQLGKKNVLMLEDDAYITGRFDRVLNELTPDINKLNWDIIYFGWWIGEENDDFNNKIEDDYEDGWVGINRAARIGGLHGALINHTLYKPILTLPPVDPIDCQLNRFHKMIKSYYITPKVIHVRNMPSRCDNNMIVRNQL